MSNDKELEIDNQEETDLDSEDTQVDTESSETTHSEEAKQVKSPHQGRVDKEFIAITRGEKRLEDVPESLRDDVSQLINRVPKAVQVTDEMTAEIAKKIKQDMELDNSLSFLDEQEVPNAKSDYKIFVSGGASHEEAMSKVKKIYGIKDITSSFGTRVRPTVKATDKRTDKERLIANATPEELKMLKGLKFFKE